MSEFDLRWDDLSEGLILEISTQTPEGEERPEFGRPIQDPDERGSLCHLSGATYIYLLEPEDMKDVSQIKYRGETMVKAMGDELVVLGKLGELVATYLGDVEITYDAINALYPILFRRHSRELEPCSGVRVDIDRAIALEMGISEKVLAAAREYAYLKAELERDDGEWEDDQEKSKDTADLCEQEPSNEQE
ncbi:MAG: hypothetical protein RR672_03405 [Raoultibacter sp.]